ncbi:hypothetical protein ASU85_16125 [Klebsiella aerogenes]|nr:hypothetical protein ASU85_16125 [Klebsiella aerogenes]
MHKSDSWIINRSQTVASIIAIYPWLIILITHIKYSLVPYNFTEDGLYLLVPTTVLSIINLTLSLITIGCMSVFTLLKPRRLKIYFCAMNTCYRFGYIFMLNSKLRCIFSKKSSKAPSRTGIIMEKKPNWLVRNIKKITAVISIYPWILLLLAMMSSGPAYAALAATAMVILLFIVLSIANFIISVVIIVIADISTPSTPKSYVAYFFAMNSVSLLWLLLLFAY